MIILKRQKTRRSLIVIAEKRINIYQDCHDIARVVTQINLLLTNRRIL